MLAGKKSGVSMAKKSVINVVGIQCKPEAEDAFNKWYDQVHIPLLFKFKGLKKATRYKAPYKEEGYPTYFTVFEFEDLDAYQKYEKSPELAAARKEMDQTWKNGGWERMWRVQYEEMKVLKP
jgi:heme-degrading monooxygenase HmoA